MSFPTRKSVKAFGAVKVDENPKWHFRFAKKFNAESFIALLDQLLRQYYSFAIFQESGLQNFDNYLE